MHNWTDCLIPVKGSDEFKISNIIRAQFSGMFRSWQHSMCCRAKARQIDISDVIFV